MKYKRFIIGCEDLEDGMIIEAKDIDEARNEVLNMIDIHEVNKNNEIID
jgi:hypothetical protein